MSVAASAIAVLGAPLASFLLKQWLGKDTVLGTISESLAKAGATALAAKIEEVQLNEELARIARGVAADLSVEIQFSDSAPLVISALHDTLVALRDVDGALAQSNLDPGRLYEALRKHKPPGLRDCEEQMVDRSLERLANRMIQMLSGSDRLHAVAFRELLERSDELRAEAETSRLQVDRIEELLAVLPGLAERMDFFTSRILNSENESEKQFRHDYLRTLAEELDRMELHGVSLHEASKRYPLTVAYIRLSASSSGNSRPVDVSLAGHRRILIKGDPGSGKTTLLKWIAVQAAKSSFDGALFDWNGAIPFYVPLRHTIQKTSDTDPLRLAFPTVGDWIGLTLSPLREPNGGWTERLLQNGEALVLFDGLDEVPDSLRSDLLEQIRRLVTFYPNSTFLISSRSYAAPSEWISSQGFHELLLEDLSLSDITQLIGQWHKAVEQELASQNRSREVLELPARAEALRRELRANDVLLDLARKPLLCSVLCALNRDREGVLPDGRKELYEACLEMLLHRRDPERGIKGVDVPGLRLSHKTQLLQHIAHWFTSNGLVEAAVEDVRTRVRYRLPNLLPETGHDLNSIVETISTYLTRRTGILREPSIGRVDWVHNTFKEYLTAREICDADLITQLMDYADDDRWHEVIVFAAGVGTARQRELILQTLIQKEDVRFSFLAAACVEVSSSVDVHTRRQILNKLRVVIPPKDHLQARYVASGGVAAVPYLRPSSTWSERELLMSIEALARIGGESAVSALSEYTHHASPAVVSALSSSWELFSHRRLYAQHVLRPLLRDRSCWEPSGLQRLDGLEVLQDDCTLQRLSLKFSAVSDIGPVGSLTQLETVDISNTMVTDVRPLANCKQLRAVIMRHTLVEDVSPLAELPRLEELDVTGSMIDVAQAALFPNARRLLGFRNTTSAGTRRRKR